MEYRKSYKGFILWVLFFFISCFFTTFLKDLTENFILRLILNICTISITLLNYVIYKTEYVYWYTGTTYEEAKEAGSKRRKEFAYKHLKVFGRLAACYFVVSLITYFFNITYVVDLIFVLFGMIWSAISTIKFKL